MRKITLCLAYYENPGMLIQQFKHLQSLPEELWPFITLIVVDDCSGKDLSAQRAVNGLLPPVDFKLFRMKKDIPWNQDACRNLAAKQAETDWLLLTDMDHVPTKHCWWRILKDPLETDIAYTFKRISAPDLAPYKPHPNSYLMTKKMYFKTGGYDERYAGVYGTDGAFKTRLLGTARKVVELKENLIRYPREVIPDASTTSLTRKGPENDVKKIEVRDKIRKSGDATPKHGLTAWERVF